MIITILMIVIVLMGINVINIYNNNELMISCNNWI